LSFLLPHATFAASKEIVELQRDLALLQEQVRTLQRSQDEKFSAIQVLVQQALDSANKTNTSVALLQNNLQQSFKDQQKSVVDPVVGVGAKLDQMTTDVSALRESVADISSQMGKLQQQMIDIGNAVRTIQAPAAAPPPSAGPTGIRRRGAVRRCSPGPRRQPCIKTPIATAMAARRSGAAGIQRLSEVLRRQRCWRPTRSIIIAEIHAKQNNLDQALAEFDMVLEKYPDNNKTPDALYMKGATLVKMGKRTQGKQEFCELVKRFPSNDLANRRARR
jgi:tetratricopeptide (TPR) repeat protein